MIDRIQHLNPDELAKNPAFSQLVVTQGSGRTMYIGGQNAVNAHREIIGKGDIQAQTKQALKNIQTALSTCGASFENIVKLNIYIVQGQNAYAAFQASQQYIGIGTGFAPPAITVLFVAGLANPDFLIEIDAMAFIPDNLT